MRKSRSNKNTVTRLYRGFTLIEVLFAFMFLAWGFMRLFEGQSNAIQTARESQGIIIASQLARMKMLDCKTELIKQGFSASSDFMREGDFSEEGFKEYTWVCFGTRIDVPAPNLDALGKKGPEKTGENGNSGGMTAFLGPVFTLLSSALGDSARELTTVVNWKLDQEEQEIRVTTHLIDTKIISSVMNMLPKIPNKDGQ